jgi:hypothetical protein
LDGSPEEIRERVAEALHASFVNVPVERLPARLVAVCEELLTVAGASISVMDRQTPVAATLCATDPIAAELAEIQVTLGTGPSVTARDRGTPVLASNLRDGPSARLWPMFAAGAVELGACAVFSFPLAVGAISAGTLDMHRNAPGPLTDAEIRVALLIADAATLAVLRLSTRLGEEEDGVSTAWLGQAEADREEVHQATGMVMALLGVGPEEALLLLRARAFADGRSLSALAREIVERRTWPGENG